MKICKCQSTECSGQIKRYSIHSPSENTTYPNRFWGITDYCDEHKRQDETFGFILKEAVQEKRIYVL